MIIHDMRALLCNFHCFYVKSKINWEAVMGLSHIGDKATMGFKSHRRQSDDGWGWGSSNIADTAVMGGNGSNRSQSGDGRRQSRDGRGWGFTSDLKTEHLLCDFKRALTNRKLISVRTTSGESEGAALFDTMNLLVHTTGLTSGLWVS
ncbi:hypothetical protein DPMN_047372 [Dreissena polymorpha]|uniref:Uncharacterized protein n=1 Tax=Dreissena polymorpha TaxID=45954 RepID=A0A9D4I1T4_DREPO|nr:hypothetical protein DPMN_047372 [Dreissena polymorpha]